MLKNKKIIIKNIINIIHIIGAICGIKKYYYNLIILVWQTNVIRFN